MAFFLLPPLLLLLLSARLRTVSFCVGEGGSSLMNGPLGSQSTAGGDKSGKERGFTNVCSPALKQVSFIFLHALQSDFLRLSFMA